MKPGGRRQSGTELPGVVNFEEKERNSMAQNVYDTLMERGFIEQCTHPEEVRELLGGKEPVTF